MSKTATVINLEFDTADEVTAFTNYINEAHEDMSRDIEQYIAVRTGDTSAIAIRVHKDVDSHDRYDEVVQDKRRKSPVQPKDAIRFRGDVTYMFNHTEYLNV